MKRLFFLLSLAVLISGFSANVILPRAVERVWFDVNDDFFVRFGEELEYMYGDDIKDFTYITSCGTYSFPEDYTPPTVLPFEVNMSQAIPGFTIQRNADYFRVHYDPTYMFDEIITWGPQNELSVNIHPLATGQSAVQAWETGYDGMEYYDIRVWAKDIGTVSPYPYHPSTPCTLMVHVEDPESDPVPWIPIYYSFPASPHPNTIIPHGYTNAEGNWQKPYYYAVRTQLWINDPQSQTTVVDTLFFPEPGETIQINAVVSTSAGNDPNLVPNAGILTLYPSVLNNSTGYTINMKYEADTPLFNPAVVTLYNLRGRALASMPMPVSGYTEWTLPSLSSGIYFVGLNYSGRQIARQRLTIIK